MAPSPSRDLAAELRWLYDSYRTALLNRKYYAHRLLVYQRWNLILELAVAVGTSGAIGAWAIWKQGVGRNAWAFLAGLAALIAVVKPIIQLPKRIERYSKLHVAYSELYQDIDRLVSEVKLEKLLTKEMCKSVRLAAERHYKLELEDDPKPVKHWVQRFYDEVNREIPASTLWMPIAAETSRG